MLNQLFFRLSKLIGGIYVFKWLARNHPRILMYHRVFPDSSGKALHPKMFLKQMQLIKKEFNVISLNTLLKKQKAKELIPKNCIVITFDDGYADFYEYVYPIMRELDLPVSFCITAGFVDNKFWFWPDKLRYLLEHSVQQEISTALGTLSIKKHCTWEKLADYCLTLSTSEQESFLAELQLKMKVSLPTRAPKMYHAVSWEQLKEMSESVVDIICHSMTHPILSHISDDELQREIVDSKKLIESHIGQTVNGFCYPNGMPEDFTNNVQKALQSAEYEYAIVAYPSAQPLKKQWAIARYPLGNNFIEFEKVVYGLRFQAISQKHIT